MNEFFQAILSGYSLISKFVVLYFSALCRKAFQVQHSNHNKNEVSLMQKYSMTERDNNLSTLIHMLEQTGTPVELSQRGKTVAILVPKWEYDNLTKPKLSPWETLMAFREEEEIESLDIDTEIFNERKAQENGRETHR
jgi:prevent-host-death family protein